MKIDISVLWRIFNSTTNSYKYLFFISVMELLKNKGFKEKKLTYREISCMMLAYAWYPKIYFRLSFGKQDQIGKYLENIPITRKLRSVGTLYTKILSDSSISLEPLMRHVPTRLIREFFADDLKDVKDQYVDAFIASLSEEKINSSIPPLYKVDRKKQEIEFSDGWLSFLESNFNPIFTWGLWHWALYLQKHNPNSPAVLNKLIPPQHRESLAKQKQAWDTLINGAQIRCIYTNEIIKKKYHLDHFLPWSFIAHNQPWNLVPTSPELNLSKSDSIPSDIYIPLLAEIHLKLLHSSRKQLVCKKFKLDYATYLEALNIEEFDKLLDGNHLTERYIKTYRPLIDIAKNSGFPGDWMWV